MFLEILYVTKFKLNKYVAITVDNFARLIIFRPRQYVSGYFGIRNFFFPDSKISTSTRILIQIERIRIQIEFAHPHVFFVFTHVANIYANVLEQKKAFT